MNSSNIEYYIGLKINMYNRRHVIVVDRDDHNGKYFAVKFLHPISYTSLSISEALLNLCWEKVTKEEAFFETL